MSQHARREKSSRYYRTLTGSVVLRLRLQPLLAHVNTKSFVIDIIGRRDIQLCQQASRELICFVSTLQARDHTRTLSGPQVLAYIQRKNVRNLEAISSIFNHKEVTGSMTFTSPTLKMGSRSCGRTK